MTDSSNEEIPVTLLIIGVRTRKKLSIVQYMVLQMKDCLKYRSMGITKRCIPDTGLRVGGLNLPRLAQLPYDLTGWLFCVIGLRLKGSYPFPSSLDYSTSKVPFWDLVNIGFYISRPLACSATS